MYEGELEYSFYNLSCIERFAIYFISIKHKNRYMFENVFVLFDNLSVFASSVCYPCSLY